MLRQKKEEKAQIKLQKASAGVGGVQVKGVEKKRKFKGIRIRRNLTVRGIKIKWAVFAVKGNKHREMMLTCVHPP